jgi:hypothetical protein
MYIGATIVETFQAEVSAALFTAITLSHVPSSSSFGREEATA